MADWMDPPWFVEPAPWLGERWILTRSEYLDRWRSWFCDLDEMSQSAYREAYIPPRVSSQFYDVFGMRPYDPALAAAAYRDRDGHLTPPWVAFPKIPLGSIGWRMGAGEDYWIEFDKFYTSLSSAQKADFRVKYPEPAEVAQGLPWTGFYDRKESN